MNAQSRITAGRGGLATPYHAGQAGGTLGVQKIVAAVTELRFLEALRIPLGFGRGTGHTPCALYRSFRQKHLATRSLIRAILGAQERLLSSYSRHRAQTKRIGRE